jgi:hypothetical protein
MNWLTVGLRAVGFLSRSRRRRAQSRRRVESAIVERLESRELPTVTFQFDYRYDANHFFDDPARRTSLETAGKLVAEQLTDTLTAVQPSGTNRWTPNITNPATGATTNLSGTTAVATNSILVFAGGRNISSLGIGGPGGYSASGTTTWLNTVRARGQTGAISSTNPTDTAPWGGSITFDTMGVNWNFGLTTSTLASNQVDFLSVAVHELTHVIGFVSSNKAFTRNINAAGSFIGTNAVAANNGATVPMDSTRGHWREGQRSDGLETAMDPSLTVGTRKLLTTLDRAALKDMGWTLTTVDDTVFTAPQRFTHTTTGITDTFSVTASVESSSDVDLYRIWGKVGTTLTVTLTPGAGFNSAIRLFDQSGQQLQLSNNGVTGIADTLTFTLTRSDFFYVGISSSARLNYDPLRTGVGTLGTTGSYSLSLRMS